MKCLVTGGTGFVGSNLVDYLLKLGHEVYATATEGEQKLPEGVRRLGRDLFSIDWDTLKKIDVLFHQAANNDTTLLDRSIMFKDNVDASREVFTKAIGHGCKHIVYASSTAIYGNGQTPYKEDQELHPLNPYAESKILMEKVAAEIANAHPDISIVGLRYCNVYGPGEGHKEKRSSMIHQLAQQMKVGIPRIFKWGDQKRDYIYIKDCITANMLAAEARQSCVVNCGYGQATTFNDVIKHLNEAMKVDKKPEYFDNPFEGRYQNHTECDMTLAKEKIGFTPAFNIKKGIMDFAKSGFPE
ncbi:MAG: NAD-dependent epimerase/dehydratase family protein [Nanoarchaeota archaeon]